MKRKPRRKRIIAKFLPEKIFVGFYSIANFLPEKIFAGFCRILPK